MSQSMPVAQWPLRNGRPTIEVETLLHQTGQSMTCCLVADTGAGSQQSLFELVLEEAACRACGGIPMGRIQLGGAYSGVFAVYLVQVRLASLSFDQMVPAVGVPAAPHGFHGIAGFRFLNRFHYGNFGDISRFALHPLPTP